MKTKKFYACVGLGLTQLALLTGNASAQDTIPAARNLDEVVVTASRSAKKRSEIGKVVRVITAETLAKSQGRTLPEVLNNVAGLTIGGTGNNLSDIKSVYLRGASAGNTLILVDGIPVNDASGISGEYNISAVPVDQIERIEIVKGGNSTLYGSDAVAGVINIITKKGSGKLTASLLATGGSYDTYKQVLGLNGQIGNISVAVNASNLNSNNFSTAKPQNNELGFDKDGFTQRSVSLNVSQQTNSNLLFKANLLLNQNEAGLDNGAFADALNYTYDKNSLLAGLSAGLLLRRGELNFNVNQNNVKNLFNNGDTALTNNTSYITHAEANLSYELASFIDLTSGASYKFSETDQRSPFGSLSADNNIASVFTSLFFKAKGGFRAELGGRYNDHSQYGNNFTYTINPSYLIAKRYKLFVNLSSAYRVPSLYQLYQPDFGNTDLLPETSQTYEAGFEADILPGKLNLNFAYFKREIDDVINFDEISAGRFGYLNRDKQNDEGYEAELVFKPADALTINAFYAYVDGKVKVDGQETFNLFRRPKNTAGVNAGIGLGKSVFFNLTYKWTDKRIDNYFDSSTFETVRVNLDAYSMLDAYIQYKPNARLTLFTDVKNILDEDYTEFAGYTTRGLNFNAGFRYEIR